MTASVNISAKAANGVAATTLTSASFTIGGNNRVLYIGVGSGATVPVAPSTVKWQGVGGVNLTQLDITRTVATNVDMSIWRLIAPAIDTNTFVVTWPSNQDEKWAIAVCWQDVDQVTPNSAITYATGSGTGPTVNATTTAGQQVQDFGSWLNVNGNSCTVVVDASQVSIQEIEGVEITNPGLEGGWCSRELAAGASTTMSAVLSGGTINGWGTFAFGLNDASASFLPLMGQVLS